MQSPEAWTFKEPPSNFKVKEFSSSSEDAVKKLCNFDFNHLVSVTLPDCLRIPKDLALVLSKDCEYYRVLDVNITTVLHPEFLDCFIRKGHFIALSIGTRIDCDNCVAVTAAGVLILTLTKDTYQTLGLEGHPSHFTQRNRNRYVVKINLHDTKLELGKATYQRTRTALKSLGTFNVIITWEPPDTSVCPSSVAKFFNDLGHDVRVCEPTINSHVVYSAKVPLAPAGEEDIVDFVEWLGMVAVEGNLEGDEDNYVNNYQTPEPHEVMGQVRFLQWSGFYLPQHVTKLIRCLMEYNNKEDKLWIALYMQGFSDMPIIAPNEEHHYYTNGDNGNLLILTKSKTWYCTQRCSQKKYK